MANNEPMTAERRAAIKARADAATPGPWVVSSEYASGVELGYKPDHERTWGYGCSNDFVCDLNDGEYHEYHNKAEQMANASFIAHARQDIPDLLAEVERLRAREEWLVTQLAEGGEWFCPMDDNYRCEWRSGDLCEMKSSKSREQCWSKAADMATRENPGNSGEVPENPGEGKAK